MYVGDNFIHSLPVLIPFLRCRMSLALRLFLLFLPLLFLFQVPVHAISAHHCASLHTLCAPLCIPAYPLFTFVHLCASFVHLCASLHIPRLWLDHVHFQLLHCSCERSKLHTYSTSHPPSTTPLDFAFKPHPFHTSSTNTTHPPSTV